MKRIYLDEVEMFPVYTLDEEGGIKEIEVSDEFYERYLRIRDDFVEMQNELAEL